MDSKALSGVEIKDADKGHVEAVFSTFGVKDHDGDVTEPGAFEDGANVLISAYNHQSWMGALPVGKGTIHSTKNGAILKGQFFLNTQHGRDTFETVKQVSEAGLQEWSYGFDVEDSAPGEFKGENVRYLRKLKVYEVSPVMKGAGIGTGTLAVKRNYSTAERRTDAQNGSAMSDGSFPIENEDDLHNAIRLAGHAHDPEAARRHIIRRARALGLERLIPDDWTKMRLPEQAEAVLADLMEFRGRAAEVVAKRLEKGKGLGEESEALVRKICSELEAIQDLLRNEPEESKKYGDELMKVRLRSIALFAND